MNSVENELRKQLTELNQLIEECIKRKKAYKNLEDGKLRVTESNGCPQYFFRSRGGSDYTYIPSYEKGKINLLANRDYNEKVYKKLLEMKNRVSRFMDGYDFYAIDHIYNRMCRGRKNIVTPIRPTEEMIVNEWMEEHHGNQNTYGEAKDFKTERGDYVRSKSEKILADYFYRNCIPYQYEPRYEMSDYRSVFPDFALLNIRLRKTFYWEHLGLIDYADYASSNLKKLMEYENSGLILGDNLIITMETKDNPLNVELVEEKINRFLK